MNTEKTRPVTYVCFRIMISSTGSTNTIEVVLTDGHYTIEECKKYLAKHKKVTKNQIIIESIDHIKIA